MPLGLPGGTQKVFWQGIKHWFRLVCFLLFLFFDGSTSTGGGAFRRGPARPGAQRRACQALRGPTLRTKTRSLSPLSRRACHIPPVADGSGVPLEEKTCGILPWDLEPFLAPGTAISDLGSSADGSGARAPGSQTQTDFDPTTSGRRQRGAPAGAPKGPFRAPFLQSSIPHSIIAST